MIAEIRDCFGAGKIYYSKHARDEMEKDEFGEILDREVYEAVLSGKVIENYPDDFPYPSCLIYGRTRKGRPATCAIKSDPEELLLITVYDPSERPDKWTENYRKRR
jgi:hypothetical protein